MNKAKLIDYTSLKISFIIWIIINILKIPDFLFSSGISKVVVISKVCHLVFLYFMIKNIRRLWLNRNNQNGKREIIISLSFFIIAFITLLLIWPGCWNWDDIVIVNEATKYELFPWQHFITSIFHIVCMQTLPFNTGVIITQILIASMIVGYCISNIVDIIKFKNKKQSIIFIILLFIPCILPPVLEFLLGGYRMGIYSFLELLLVTKLLVNYIKQSEINSNELLNISLLTIIVASWRTESIYYVGSLFIILLAYGSKKISIKKTIITTFIVGLSVISIGKINNILIGNDNYSISASILPVVDLVKKANTNTDKKELNQINSLLNLSFIYDNYNKNGSEIYWEGVIRDNYTKQDYSKYLKGYISLSFKYPNVAFKAMFNNFLNSTGIKTKEGKSLTRSSISGARSLFDKNSSPGQAWSNSRSKLKDPFNMKVRDDTLRMLANVDKNNKVLPIYYLNWNLLIPILLLFITAIILLIKKKWFLLFLNFTIFIKSIIVFITACIPYFMYYLSVYLVGYIYSITIIYMLIFEQKKKL